MNRSKRVRAERAPRAWGEIGLRVLFSALLLFAGYQLLAQSTFAWRLREDVPAGVGTIIFGFSAFFAFLPLLMGRRYLGAYLLSGLMFSALGAYWWTMIPWEEVVTETNFTITDPPRLQDYLLVASPAALAAAYVALSRWSRMRADLLGRGADVDQVRRAAAASFLGGAVALLAAAAASGAFVALLAAGLPQRAAALPAGVPVVVLSVLLVAGVLQLYGRRSRRGRAAAATAPAGGGGGGVTRPSGRAEDSEAPVRSPARRWPS